VAMAEACRKPRCAYKRDDRKFRMRG